MAAGAGRGRRCGDQEGAAETDLYLVVDDWELGYSIHKLDVDEFESDAGGGGNKLRRLPEPCALRIEAPADCSPAILASIGTKIFFITDRWFRAETPMLIYDTETASLAVGPRPTPALRPLGFIFFVPVDQRLHAFNPRRGGQQCSFEVLSRAPRDEEDEFRLSRIAERWSVASVPAPMPLGKHELVTAYAVHPDGRTIFVSAWNRSRLVGERDEGTHSFDTRSSVWTWHGEWKLPFHDQGYYVEELDAWVGLRRDGFLCSCAVASRGGTAALPEWKLGRKTLFREDPKSHVGAPMLTYMGDGRFCLVECAPRPGLTVSEALNDEDGCVLHVTIFEVKYGKRGELETTALHLARSYLVTRYTRGFSARAFWM
ncbi:hypothetical protein C2845_PM15G20610 [Panicum miliaceum]|uniref:DUF1618 domain-containing protein n=1 Tax=Panicum miliaceum TaxID=4540 RepID=A0A3L6Q9E5_PANMI|nr:hypothetical protein C2845_PM15G20610 [Panicum miliaceum]